MVWKELNKVMKKQTKIEWQRGILAAGVLIGGLWLQGGEGLLAAHSKIQPVSQGIRADEVVQKSGKSKNTKLKVVNSLITIQYTGTNGTASNGTRIKVNGIIRDGKIV